MKRRNFLTLLGAATLAPALPAMGAPAPVAAGYNRYMYGLGVFHARTTTGVTTADLMARLKISAVQADAMIGEMTARGVLAPITGAVTNTINTTPRKPYVRKMLRHLEDALTADDAAQQTEVVLDGSEIEPTTVCGPKSGVH